MSAFVVCFTNLLAEVAQVCQGVKDSCQGV